MPIHPAFCVLHKLALRGALVAVTLLLTLWAGLFVYKFYLAHRVTVLLKEAAQIQIGASEASILPFVSRYKGARFAAWQAQQIDDCPDRAECAYMNSQLPDYSYEIELSPFQIFEATHTELHGIRWQLARLMFQTPSRWREAFALRTWMLYTQIKIRSARVVGVSSGLYVEGQDRWLGHDWSLAALMPHRRLQAKTYVVDGSFLKMTNTGGALTKNYLTPAATAEQFRAARNINLRCLSGVFPCHCLSDLSPDTFTYLRAHPGAGNTISTPGCRPSPE
jgi:hypothetical protein